jgi:tape measure domain-containing protein
MADDSTKLTIQIETILRGLDRTLRGLSQVERSLKSIAGARPSGNTAAGFDRAAAAAQKLQLQQQRLAVQAQEISNRQERARQATERLALAQQRLTDAEERQQRVLSGSSRQFSALGNSLRSIGQGLSSVGASLSVAVTAPLVALGATVVDAATRLDSLKRGLTAIVGSSDEASRQLARLTQIAKLPGIGFEEAIQGSIRLQAVGFSAKDAERALRQFSNAVALTGGGRSELERVTIQLGQLAAKGKVLSQDLRPIIEAAPAVGRALLQAFGTVNADDIQALGLSSREFLNILVSQLEQLPRAAAGAKNSFENFRDEVFRAAAAVGTVLLPALTRLVEAVGPAVTKLADTFTSLPEPLQIAVVAFTGLLAAAGPVLFIVGQLTSGVGRLIVGFAQLSAAGLLPTITNLRALAAGALTAAEAEGVLASATALVTAALGGIAVLVGAVVIAYAAYNAFQKDAASLAKEQADTLKDQIQLLNQQADFLGGLKTGVQRTADEQQRLLEIYDGLNVAAKARVAGISDEEKRLITLRAEVENLLRLRQQELVQASANLAGQLANTLASAEANQSERDAITARIQANAELIDTLQQEGKISAESDLALARRGLLARTVEEAVGALRAESENLVQQQTDLQKTAKDLNGTAKEQADVLRVLQQQTGLTARELLVAAKNMGVFRGDVDQTLKLLEQYVATTEEATRATDAFSRTLAQQSSDLLKAGEAADQAAKSRNAKIEAAASLSREASTSFQGALKDMRAFIAAQPELQQAIAREAQIRGKSFDEIVNEALTKAFGRERNRSGTSLRNAQEQLAKALADVALASSEQQVRIENDKNQRMLEAAEVGQRLQLISYREFLELRARLGQENIDREITQQQAAVTKALEQQQRLLKAAQKPGIPDAERVKRQAEAAAAQTESIKAETKLKELEGQRDQITVSLTAVIKEAQHQQLADVRQLEIRYAELQGRIEDALKTATVEEFRVALTDLAKAQEFLDKQIKNAQELRQADRVEELRQARDLNQRQIEAINNQIAARDALAELAAAQQLVNNAKERQQRLESDLTFQVEFRGKREEDAITERLAGERRLQTSLELSKSIVESLIRSFEQMGKTPPVELQKFVDELNTQLKGLGELSFTEQFRLAEKEFTRIQDELADKIADVERAIRSRDISEIEGRLLIRRLNGEYVGDLEKQLELLKQIAAQSNDATLKKQATSAQQQVKDTRAAADEVKNLNTQLKSVSVDALNDSLGQFFRDLADNTQSAAEDIANFFKSILRQMNDFVSRNLAREITESLFPDPNKQRAGAGGFLAAVKRVFGLGGGGATTPTGQGAVGGLGAAATGAAGATLQTAATTAATTLQTGATTAAATLQTGASTAAATTATSAVTFTTAVTTAATAFATAVTAAGAAFAAAVGAASGAQAFSGGANALGSGIGDFATGDIIPARPGGRLVNVVEGGFAEAVMTTDPRHAARQARILSRFLRLTKGLQGRFPVPQLAEGAIITPRQAELNLLSGMTQRTPQVNTTLPDSQVATAGTNVNFRNINLFDRREMVRGYIRSAEGAHDILNVISENAPDIGRRIGVR